jgi:hypothetical protein
VKLTSKNDAVTSRLEPEDEADGGEAIEQNLSDIAGQRWRTSSVLDLSVNQEGEHIPE